MRGWTWGVGSLVLGSLAACAADDAPPPAISSGGSSNAAASSDSGTTGAVSTSGEMSTTGEVPTTSSTTDSGTTSAPVSEECRACWTGACSDDADACFAEEACACRFGCQGDVVCEGECDDSAVYGPLLRCLVEASAGSCATLCAEPCNTCFIEQCRPDFDACIDDTACLCQLWCDKEQMCLDRCGPPSPLLETLEDCFAATAVQGCTEACA